MAGGLGAFRSLLATPGGVAQSGFGLLGRAPAAMMGVGFVAAASSVDGDAGYALGGLAAGAYSLATAFAGPSFGSLADRFGQSRIGIPTALVSAGAAFLAVLSLLTLGATWLLVPLAALTGATQPNVSAFSRVRWAALFPDDSRANTAQAWESVIDELTFLIGPSVVALLIGVWFDGLPIALAAGCLLVGVAGITTRLALPEPAPHPAEPGIAPWRSEFPPGAGLLVAVVAMGLTLGAVQVLQLAYTRAIGAEDGTALVFFVTSALSLAGAVIVGAMHFHTPVRRRFTIAMVAYAIGVIPLALVGGFLPFLVASAIAGAAIAPTFVQVNALIAEETPARVRTGAFALAASAVGLGIAGGAALAGWLVSEAGGDQARLIIVPLAIATGVGGLAADLGHRRVRDAAAPDADSPVEPEDPLRA
jgi:MFS family permease